MDSGPRPVGVSATTGSDAVNQSLDLVKLHVGPGAHSCRGSPRPRLAGKPRSRILPGLPQAWAGQRGSGSLAPARSRPRPTRGPRPLPFPSPGRRRRLGGPPPASRRPQQPAPRPLHPEQQLGRPESRPRPEVSGDGGAGDHRGRGLAAVSEPLTRGKNFAARHRSRGGVRRTPNLSPTFLVPSWSPPASLHPGGSRVPWRDSGGGDARGMPAGPGAGGGWQAGAECGTLPGDLTWSPWRVPDGRVTLANRSTALRPDPLRCQWKPSGGVGGTAPCRTGPPHPLQPLGGAGLVAREGATK